MIRWWAPQYPRLPTSTTRYKVEYRFSNSIIERAEIRFMEHGTVVVIIVGVVYVVVMCMVACVCHRLDCCPRSNNPLDNWPGPGWCLDHLRDRSPNVLFCTLRKLNLRWPLLIDECDLLRTTLTHQLAYKVESRAYKYNAWSHDAIWTWNSQSASRQTHHTQQARRAERITSADLSTG